MNKTFWPPSPYFYKQNQHFCYTVMLIHAVIIQLIEGMIRILIDMQFFFFFFLVPLFYSDRYRILIFRRHGRLYFSWESYDRKKKHYSWPFDPPPPFTTVLFIRENVDNYGQPLRALGSFLYQSGNKLMEWVNDWFLSVQSWDQRHFVW